MHGAFFFLACCTAVYHSNSSSEYSLSPDNHVCSQSGAMCLAACGCTSSRRMSRESDKRVVGESDTLKPQSGFLMLQNLPSACNYPCNPWNLSHESRSRCEQKRRCEVRMNQRKQNILPEYNEEVNDLIQKFIANTKHIAYIPGIILIPE